MQPVEFAIWAILAVFTAFFLINWILNKRRYRNTILFDERERIALQAAPWILIGWTAVLLLFLLVNLNKLYLLIVFPLVYMSVITRLAKW